MRRVVASGRAWGLAAASLAALSCSPGPRGGARSGAAPAPPGQHDPLLVAPARFLPDVTPASSGLIDILPDGSRRFIVSGIRVVDHPDGSIERAREVLPAGVAKVVPLP